ncbi:NACHT domain-containing protein [Nonomuraea typhae]|uniref:NACHT domain-containing protein n=1 Tax=Nonomuraea typhae TaxID=2603600 RepID=UPI0012FA8073|nr:NACHT domain-containing protein [Nonomuraea typhae]
MGTEIIVALIGLAGGLVTAGLGFYQWRKTHRATHEPAPAKRTRSAEKALGRRRTGLLNRLTDDMRHITLLNRPKPLNIESLYVQVRVHDQRPLRFMHHEELQELRGRQLDDLIELTRAREDEREAEELTPEEALARFRRIVVLGDPGAGKTTMLRYLGFKAAQDGILPVFVELRRLAEGSVLDYVGARWAERYGEPDAAELVEHALTSGAAVLLVDGLDEVQGGDAAEAAYQRVIQEIDRLAARYPAAAIAVTCRRAGWRGQLPAFRTLEVLDFDNAQINQFVGNWFDDDPAKRDKLGAALRRSTRMQTLSANPLLLSLIAIVFESDLELPERRSKLYARTIEVLLSEWDSRRDINRFPRFTADRKRDLLEEIAWHYQRERLAYFPKDELLGMIAEFLPSVDLDPADAPAILGEICEHYGLLKEQAHEVYGFLHLTVQEYFAAAVAARIGAPAIEEIALVRHDPWWEEVILLLAGQLHDATPLLLALLGRGPDQAETAEWLAADDDMFHNDLLLAGQCLVSTPRIRAAWLRGRIVEQVGELMLTSPHEPVSKRAAELFKELGQAGRIETRPQDAETPGPDFLEEWDELILDDPALVLEWLERLAPHATHSAGLEPLHQLMSRADERAIPLLWRLHDLAREDIRAVDLLGDCWRALLRLGEIREEQLWELTDRDMAEIPYAVLHILTTHSDQHRRLAALIDPRTHRVAAAELFFSLRESATSALVEPVLGHLRDETIPWPTRWMLTELLDRFDTDLIGILADERVHPMVRTGVAATLAVQGRKEGLPRLLESLPHGLTQVATSAHPNGHRLATFRQNVFPQKRVYTCLARSGDTDAINVLLARFDSLATTQSPTHPRLKGRAELMLDGLAVAAPEHTTRRLLEVFEGMPAITSWPGNDSLLANLTTVLPPGLTAETLRRVRALSLPPKAAGDAAKLIKRIGEIAEDPETVRELLKIVDQPGRVWDPADAMAALPQVCARARVRVFPDGRVA